MIAAGIQNQLKKALMDGEKFPPLICEDGKYFLPYEEILIRAKPRPDGAYSHGHFIIEFRHKGELIKSQHCGPVHFSAGDTLALTQMNGRFELDLT